MTPHQIAVIRIYEIYRNVEATSEALNYSSDRYVRRVLSDYKKRLREGSN